MTPLAYLMGTFPALTETFILGEIEALGETLDALRAGTTTVSRVGQT